MENGRHHILLWEDAYQQTVFDDWRISVGGTDSTAQGFRYGETSSGSLFPFRHPAAL
jgi:hypothetical protein